MSRYYEVENGTGQIQASGSGELPVDENNMFNGRLIVYDDRVLLPMQHYNYDFEKKVIVKKSDKEIEDYKEAKRARKEQFKLEEQQKKESLASKVSIIEKSNSTDKEKLNALIEILKDKGIIPE